MRKHAEAIKLLKIIKAISKLKHRNIKIIRCSDVIIISQPWPERLTKPIEIKTIIEKNNFIIDNKAIHFINVDPLIILRPRERAIKKNKNES